MYGPFEVINCIYARPNSSACAQGTLYNLRGTEHSVQGVNALKNCDITSTAGLPIADTLQEWRAHGECREEASVEGEPRWGRWSEMGRPIRWMREGIILLVPKDSLGCGLVISLMSWAYYTQNLSHHPRCHSHYLCNDPTRNIKCALLSHS